MTDNSAVAVGVVGENEAFFSKVVSLEAYRIKKQEITWDPVALEGYSWDSNKSSSSADRGPLFMETTDGQLSLMSSWSYDDCVEQARDYLEMASQILGGLGPNYAGLSHIIRDSISYLDDV